MNAADAVLDELAHEHHHPPTWSRLKRRGEPWNEHGTL
jgi:hypothetical protein